MDLIVSYEDEFERYLEDDFMGVTVRDGVTLEKVIGGEDANGRKVMNERRRVRVRR